MADLYFDADVTPSFRLLLESRSHTVLTAQELGAAAALDAEQLVTATQLGRIIITHNGKDFRTLCFAWSVWRRVWAIEPAEHTGVIAIPQRTLRPYPEAARHIHPLLTNTDHLGGQLWYYDIRIRGWVRQI